MPPKKHSTNKNQATLKQFIDKQVSLELGPIDREEKINKML